MLEAEEDITDDKSPERLPEEPQQLDEESLQLKKDLQRFILQHKAEQDNMFDETADEDAIRKAATGQANAISQTGASADDWDDVEGYYKAKIGEIMFDRYEVTDDFVGKGVFSNVCKAKDQTDGSMVAIKVMRCNDMMKKAAEKEVEILERLNKADKQNKRHVIRLHRHFMYRGHLCLVFECMWDNLRVALKKYTKDKGMSLQAVRAYTRQLLIALRHLHKCGIIHADIKPDNILISAGHNVVKICDLGSAMELTEVEPTPYLVSRFYRAPEIVLAARYSFSLDVFAMGCTLFELFTGKILFPGKTNNDMLRLFMEVKGKLPNKLIKSGTVWKNHFDENMDFKYFDVNKAGRFYNYRHQADACHAYQIMLKSGVPAENIILMMQDDVAKSSENPFPGQLFNKPGDDSVDVYKGCKVDYAGDIVTAELFMDVLTGKAQKVKGKVLKSTEKDTVFVNFVDHGGPGIVAFPNGPVLHVKDLSETLESMRSQQMFGQMVFYMEACESGSMFPDLSSDSKILAVTASNGQESSWGTYCGDEAVVKGKNVGSCLGDLFSVNWMEDDDLGKLATETFKSQIAKVTKLTNKSHVCSFGDKSFEEEAIGKVEAEALGASEVSVAATAGAVDARDVYVTQAYWAWQQATGVAKETAWQRLVGTMRDREADEKLFQGIASRACKEMHGKECQEQLLSTRREINDLECHYQLVHTFHAHCPKAQSHHAAGGWNGYNMKFSQVLVNLCEAPGLDTQRLVQIVQATRKKITRTITDLSAKRSVADMVGASFGGVGTSLPTISEQGPDTTGGELEKDSPRLSDGTVTSVGSRLHPQCTPCVFMALTAGGGSVRCSAGIKCEYCHFPHPMTKKEILRRLRNSQ
ncbi:unnamed protein product [Effrenium voratum]|uniref:legumain n=1 Tax=Effrenium voratum TaxID=2562239 RepID=A0AA36IFU4_9DINO|nr:unnamed protein product [Effrenium voratum]